MKNTLKKFQIGLGKFLVFIIWLMVFALVAGDFDSISMKSMIIIWALLTLIDVTCQVKKVCSIRKKEYLLQDNELEESILVLKDLTEIQFRELVLYIFSSQGYRIVLTKKENNIILENDTKSINVLLCFSEVPIAEKVMKQSLEILKEKSPKTCVLVSNQEFTQQAQYYAKEMGIITLGGTRLNTLFEKNSQNSSETLRNQALVEEKI
ncbi:MAG: restriction endonuclease [Cellulosilyticaceae bacterium]